MITRLISFTARRWRITPRALPRRYIGRPYLRARRGRATLAPLRLTTYIVITLSDVFPTLGEPDLKPRPPRRRKFPSRDTVPPQVPETVSDDRPAEPAGTGETDLLPEHIRRMLEAAYT